MSNDIVPKPNDLLPPPLAMEPGAVEVLRVWVAPGHDQQVSFKTTWEDPGVWGTMLAGVVRHAAEAYEKQGHDPQQAFERIFAMFEAEFTPAVESDGTDVEFIEDEAGTDSPTNPIQ